MNLPPELVHVIKAASLLDGRREAYHEQLVRDYLAGYARPLTPKDIGDIAERVLTSATLTRISRRRPS